MNHEPFIYHPGKSRLSQFNPADTRNFDNKEEALLSLNKSKKKLANLQDLLYADCKNTLLVILQGMDASGKDGIIKHVLSGINPQGFAIKSFTAPSEDECKHDYLWRCIKEMPERGHIGIFNRSYYEEVLIVRIHPEFLLKQKLPNLPQDVKNNKAFWDTRYKDINNFEKYLDNNGIKVLKIFLNISKEEQKQRFLKRINLAAKNWKFKPDDISERAYWDEYQSVYEETLIQTSTKYAPWYIIPADKKWYARATISNIIVDTLEDMKLKYPDPSYKQKRGIIEAKHILENE